MHEVRRQRMHGQQFIRRSVLGWKRSPLLEARSEERGDRHEQIGDVVRRLTNQGLVHEETQFVLDALHDRKPM